MAHIHRDFCVSNLSLSLSTRFSSCCCCCCCCCHPRCLKSHRMNDDKAQTSSLALKAMGFSFSDMYASAGRIRYGVFFPSSRSQRRKLKRVLAHFYGGFFAFISFGDCIPNGEELLCRSSRVQNKSPSLRLRPERRSNNSNPYRFFCGRR
jgi:hypothetical protein